MEIQALIEYGIASSAKSGEEVSGDAHVILGTEYGAIVAVIDGMGHGDVAHAVAQEVANTIKAHADDSIVQVVQTCHSVITGTRGATLAVAAFDASDNTITWVGVGNVRGKVFRASPTDIPRVEYLLPRPGVVGYVLPPLGGAILVMEKGDTLIFATDGVGPSFVEDVDPMVSPQLLANDILENYSTGQDDALVCVVKYLGARGRDDEH